MSISINPHRSQVAPHPLSWSNFFLFLGIAIAMAGLIAFVLPLTDDSLDRETVVKVVENSPTRYGPRITLVDQLGTVSLTVTGVVADAILRAQTTEGDENPQHEVLVKYRTARRIMGPSTTELVEWYTIDKASIW